jgi:hypothetical protein
MTSCSRSTAVAAAIAVIAALAMPGAAAREPAPVLVAQGLAPPVPLAPRPLAPVPAPPESTAAPGEPAAESVDTAPTAEARSVEVKTLSKVDPDSVGVIDASQGGFAVNMWEGTDRALVAKLLPLLPGRMSSPVMRQLTRRLLLTRALAPQGEVDGDSLLALRVQRLFAMGDLAAVHGLLQNAPAQLVEESLTRTAVESLFFGNDNAGACKQVRSSVQMFQGSYWQQAIAFCLALGGQHARAALVADILAEREGAADEAFFTAMDALAGGRDAVVEALPDPMALRISMMRAANLKLPNDVATSGKPPILRAVAISPNAELDLRLDAAERAEALGALSPAELREIYASVPFEKPELDNPLSTAEAIWGPRGRALLVRAANLHRVSMTRAEVLQRAWRLGTEKGGGDVFLRVSIPELLAIEPAGELMWFAGDAARALFAAGRRAEAFAWYDLVSGEAETNSDAATAVAALWPLVVLSDTEDSIRWDPDGLRRWWAIQKDATDARTIRRAHLLFSLFEALDKQVPVGLWAEVIGDPKPASAQVPNPALRHALRGASEDLRLGETVLLAILTLGEAGVRSAGPVGLEVTIRALKLVGLHGEARLLALEAAIAAGI